MRSGNGRFRMSVRTGALRDPSQVNTLGATGFRFAVTGVMPEEYRSNLFGSSGVNAGITTDGRLFVGNQFSSDSISASHLEDIRLEIEINCQGANAEANIRALPGSGSGSPLGAFSASVRSDPLIGNIGLFCGPIDNSGQSNASRRAGSIGDFRFWFSDWSVSGNKIKEKKIKPSGRSSGRNTLRPIKSLR